jgi:hypothetical protein
MSSAAPNELSREQILSIRHSYLNILAFFLESEKIESRYIRCLLKWALQLKITSEDLNKPALDISTFSFSLPGKVEKLEAIYHLVYMIYLDQTVEDVELEVATIYAEKLGFKAGLVSELFASIVTADNDQSKSQTIRKEVIDFLKLHEPEI